MIKVKEYLDENFYQIGNCTAKLKDNGHYNVQGEWIYPKGWEPRNEYDSITGQPLPNADHMLFIINNETIIEYV